MSRLIVLITILVSPTIEGTTYHVVNDAASCVAAGYSDIVTAEECGTAFNTLLSAGQIINRGMYHNVWGPDSEQLIPGTPSYFPDQYPHGPHNCGLEYSDGTSGYFNLDTTTPPTTESSRTCLTDLDNDGFAIDQFDCICKGSDTAGSSGDPHMYLAYGGRADFRGINDTYFHMLSSPDYSFMAKTNDATFMLKHKLKVDGSFFTSVAWILRSVSGEMHFVSSSADRSVGFVVDGKRFDTWSSWKSKDSSLEVKSRQLTFSVTSNEWQVNATRKPVYNFITGPRWRFDFSMTLLASKCVPHGIIGQSFDGSGKARIGSLDSYEKKSYVRTVSMAEGAIEGVAFDYIATNETRSDFKFSHFDKCVNVKEGFIPNNALVGSEE